MRRGPGGPSAPVFERARGQLAVGIEVLTATADDPAGGAHRDPESLLSG
ncbi:hypothetical protein ACH4UM_37085 [Streptomyces sp. NPDC020801]